MGKFLELNIRALTEAERKYAYPQSTQIAGQTGCIGHLRGDFGFSGKEFNTAWRVKTVRLETCEFKAELQKVIKTLHEDKGILHNCHDMAAFVAAHPDTAFPGSNFGCYGVRVDASKYAFLLRCNRTKDDYDYFYCYCYVKDWLDGHIRKAEQGIRFIDPHYNEKFRIPDGGKIIIHYAWGEKAEKTCRFIDEYHTEIGGSLYHICEFGELLEKNGHSVEPLITE